MAPPPSTSGIPGIQASLGVLEVRARADREAERHEQESEDEQAAEQAHEARTDAHALDAARPDAPIEELMRPELSLVVNTHLHEPDEAPARVVAAYRKAASGE